MMIMIMTTEIAARGGWGPGPWWPVFPLFWLLFWGAVIFAIFRFRRGGWWHRGHTAEEILAERYARGEIDVEEYRQRLRTLKERPS